MEDLYQILDVARDASQAEIKRAYRRLACQYHPDANPGDKDAEEKFKKINAAYSVLSDPEKRVRYDRFGSADGSDPFGGTSSPGTSATSSLPFRSAGAYSERAFFMFWRCSS